MSGPLWVGDCNCSQLIWDRTGDCGNPTQFQLTFCVILFYKRVRPRSEPVSRHWSWESLMRNLIREKPTHYDVSREQERGVTSLQWLYWLYSRHDSPHHSQSAEHNAREDTGDTRGLQGTNMVTRTDGLTHCQTETPHTCLCLPVRQIQVIAISEVGWSWCAVSSYIYKVRRENYYYSSLLTINNVNSLRLGT